MVSIISIQFIDSKAAVIVSNLIQTINRQYEMASLEILDEQIKCPVIEFENHENVGVSFSMFGYLAQQQIWDCYMTSVMTLLQIQDEATDRGISIEGKTQEQLAKEIIHYECDHHGTTYLLEE